MTTPHGPRPTTTHRAASRRTVLTLGATGLATAATAAGTAPIASAASATVGHGRGRLDRALGALEHETGVRVGVVAGRGARSEYAWRGGEAFPMCSLFKALVVGQLLRDHADDDAFWARGIRFTAADVVVNSPICAADPDRMMTVAELADAALRYSDNTAGNLLLDLVGGPPAVGRYARTFGAIRTRLDRREPELNEATPGDPRDSSTPADIHRLYGSLLLGDALSVLGQARLRSWMLRNTSAGERIGKVLPAGAELADKTGAGGYGVVNDAGAIWSGGASMTLVIMTRTDDVDAVWNNTVVQRAARLLIEAFLR